jgi:hypothetical protein
MGVLLIASVKLTSWLSKTGAAAPQGHVSRRTENIINKTPIVINHKTTFFVARYHGCLVNCFFLLIASVKLTSWLSKTGAAAPQGHVSRRTECLCNYLKDWNITAVLLLFKMGVFFSRCLL